MALIFRGILFPDHPADLLGFRQALARLAGALSCELAFSARRARSFGRTTFLLRRMEGEYTGHVKDGKVHGVGVCVYTDGSRYQGDWKAGLKCGRGTHSFASGDQFEGEWENGWMHGLGVYTWKIGDKYIGEVHYGRIHGFGTYTWRTNSKCVRARALAVGRRPRSLTVRLPP